MSNVFGIGLLAMSVLNLAHVFSGLASGEIKTGILGTMHRDVTPTEFWGVVALGLIVSTFMGFFGAAILLGWVLR